MQKITNKGNLPEFMVKAVVSDYHDMADAKYSVTQLCKPPRILQLERRHKEEMVVEVSDFWNMFIGSAVHNGIYNAMKDNDDFILEKRYLFEHDGVTISGTPDCYQKSVTTLYDHKTMSTASASFEVKDEYEQQLNVYAYVLRSNGLAVTRIMLNCVYLDWRKSATKFASTTYPAAPCRLVSVPVWSDEKCAAFISKRIAEHEAAERLADTELPTCSEKETWEVAGKLAVYPKGGALKALKLCKNEQEVTEWLQYKKMARSAIMIDYRPTARRRCEQYCSAAPYCNQYKKWLADQEEAKNEV